MRGDAGRAGRTEDGWMSAGSTAVASRSNGPAPRARPDAARARASAPAASAPGLVLRRCACGGGCPACRTRASGTALPVNTPGDAYEREADRMADAVMSAAPVPRTEESSTATLRRCACGGSCPSCRKKKEEGEDLRRDEAGAGGAPGFAPPIVHDVLASPGRPLEARTRGWMEERFGADFGGVRVHDGGRAAESARAVDAHAYAVGSHLVFGAGRYAPGTAAGDRLLAHELTHVLQQRRAHPAAAVPMLQRQQAPAEEEPSCKDAPRRLGDITPEMPCDRPTIDLTGMSGSPQLHHFHFCLDSDVLLGTSANAIRAFVLGQAATTTFVVHGFASTDGAEDYNQRLSCHRAQRVFRELRNAGVRAEQVREVSGVGETTAFSFGDPTLSDANRVVVVFAETGRIEPFADQTRPAATDAEKREIVDAAVDRLLSGQYRLAADAYLSFWTCGRTPTVRHAVERLRVLLPTSNTTERLRAAANGVEEDPALGINTVRISNAALRADNPVSCTMGRLIDMAFHHALKNETGVSGPLTELDPALRHQAGLHLISLAGIDACAGALATPGTAFGREPTGIDAPRDDDPLVPPDVTPPPCAPQPEQTRQVTPAQELKGRASPDFVFDARFDFGSGTLNTEPDAGSSIGTLDSNPSVASTATPAKDVVKATANVTLLGDPKTFGDYEIGFTQTILDDLMIAQYVSGGMVVQRLPVPIRAAGLKGAPVPVPWMAGTGQRPAANGGVSISAGWRLQTDYAHRMQLLQEARPGDLLDTWQRRTSVAIWLVARRMGAPLDRFSVVPIDGRTYDVAQNMNLEFRRIPGDLMEPAPTTLEPDRTGEREVLVRRGKFSAVGTSGEPADMRIAQLAGPAAADIDLRRQIMRILQAPAATEAGLTTGEYIQHVARILDTPEILDRAGTRAAPRLGFVFSPLTFTMRFDTRSGRLIPVSDIVNTRTGQVRRDRTESSVIVDSPGVGRVALNHLALALGLRIQKLDAVGEGRPIVLRASAIPRGGILVFTLPALLREPQLLQDAQAKREMAEMWACSEKTIKSPSFIIGKEFAKTYWVDREGSIRRNPPDGFFTSRATGEDITTNMTCGHPAGAALGTAHSHPEDSGDGPNPSEQDLKTAASGNCGRQHFIISEDLVVMYFPDGTQRTIGARESVLPRGVQCSQSIPEDQEIV